MLVLNTSMDTQHIEIVNADGSRDTITLMPRGGRAVKLPEGTVIEPGMIPQYKKFLKTEPKMDEAAAAPIVQAPADATESVDSDAE